jgi:hypothetical protein
MPEEILEQYIKEATYDIEQVLTQPNWNNATTTYYPSFIDMLWGARVVYTRRCRYLFNFDPMAKQAIRIWTDYSFGAGLSWTAKNDDVQNVLSTFWNSPDNRTILSAKGQRKSSDKVLVDGEIFFAIFLGPADECTLRWVDPLEITEIISNPEDIEDVMYFKREWTNSLGIKSTSYYRSHTNIDDIGVTQANGKTITKTEDALIYHLALNTIGQRGNSLLLPAVDWIDQFRRFLAARIAIVRSLARFAWKNKVMGGAGAVGAVLGAFDSKSPQAGSMQIENQGSNLEPIRTDTGAHNASADAKLLKLQIFAALGIPEQYFGDISTGNLATAKTVELPMIKQFGSYQQIWADAYIDIFNIVLDHNGISADDDRDIDFDMPEIAPFDADAAAKSIGQVVASFPQLQDSDDVLKQALLNIGITNVQDVIDALKKLQAEKDAKAAEIAKNQPPDIPAKPANTYFPTPLPGTKVVQPPSGVTTGAAPRTQESAEVRAIKALQEIREGLEHDSH